MMKVWTCTDFSGHWPAGSVAVVVAETALDAALTLRAKLGEIGLDPDDPYVTEGSMAELDLTKEHAVILCDGNY